MQFHYVPIKYIEYDTYLLNMMQNIQYIFLGILPCTYNTYVHNRRRAYYYNTVIFLCRGVPGVDWSIDAGEIRDLSKVYYNTYDPSSPNTDGGVQW